MKKHPSNTKAGLAELKLAWRRLAFALLIALAPASCTPEPPAENPLKTVLASADPAIARVMADPGKYEV